MSSNILSNLWTLNMVSEHFPFFLLFFQWVLHHKWCTEVILQSEYVWPYAQLEALHSTKVVDALHVNFFFLWPQFQFRSSEKIRSFLEYLSLLRPIEGFISLVHWTSFRVPLDASNPITSLMLLCKGEYQNRDLGPQNGIESYLKYTLIFLSFF